MLRIVTTQDLALSEAVHRYRPRMHAVALRILANPDDAEDAVQDALLSAHRGLDRFRGSSRLSTWLHRIVVNAALMQVRSRGRRRESPLELTDALACPTEWEPEPIAAERESAGRLLALIDELPRPYCEVLVLRSVRDLSMDQIARRLRLTPAAVKTRLHRARRALRNLEEASCIQGD